MGSSAVSLLLDLRDPLGRGGGSPSRTEYVGANIMRLRGCTTASSLCANIHYPSHRGTDKDVACVYFFFAISVQRVYYSQTTSIYTTCIWASFLFKKNMDLFGGVKVEC